MRVSIVGWSAVKEGVFQDRPYRNRMLYVMYLDTPDDVVGNKVECVKLKGDKTDMSGFLVGDTVNVFYDRYGNVDTICKET